MIGLFAFSFSISFSFPSRFDKRGREYAIGEEWEQQQQLHFEYRK